ncbi:MAG: DUF547 domain-containing protein [Pseudohongiellaceae bacterium]|nr:DUF547 domain-containing protein [Pseudohongiellaceae bacterium]
MIRNGKNTIGFMRAALTCSIALCSLSVAAIEPDWYSYDELLQQSVAPARARDIDFNGVDYAALRQSGKLQAIIRQLESYPLDKLANSSERLAFYINAYNIFTINLIVQNYPVESIRDLGSWWSPVWETTVGSLGGEPVTLDQIEHDILRNMGEPRIHFAIVCASLSCPDIRAEAYRANELDVQLNDQARAFLANEQKGLRLEGETARVSKIFSWFEEDFESLGGVAKFIAQYQDLPDTVKVRANLNYDWQLNDKP